MQEVPDRPQRARRRHHRIGIPRPVGLAQHSAERVAEGRPVADGLPAHLTGVGRRRVAAVHQHLRRKPQSDDLRVAGLHQIQRRTQAPEEVGSRFAVGGGTVDELNGKRRVPEPVQILPQHRERGGHFHLRHHIERPADSQQGAHV